MRKIYIILTHTGTILSQIIRYYTKDEFTHISIALDSELKEMYSFGRLNPYNPFLGSFVHEQINKGTFKRFKKTKAEVYSIFVTGEQYEKIRKTVQYFEDNKQKYKFNIIGLACVSINKKITKKNCFYCAEFVKHLLKVTGVAEVNELPEIIRPQHFKQLPCLILEYEGLLRKYKKKILNLEEICTMINKETIANQH